MRRLLQKSFPRLLKAWPAAHEVSREASHEGSHEGSAREAALARVAASLGRLPHTEMLTLLASDGLEVASEDYVAMAVLQWARAQPPGAQPVGTAVATCVIACFVTFVAASYSRTAKLL